MGKKSKKKCTREAFFEETAVRTLPPPEWEAQECSEAPTPRILLRPRVWVRLSAALRAAGATEFAAYGITVKSNSADGPLYDVQDIVIPEQEATGAFVQPLFPGELHQSLLAENEDRGLFTHIHSHHNMGIGFSGYDAGGPLRNNLAAVVVFSKEHPKGFAVTHTPCKKQLRMKADVAIGDSFEEGEEFMREFYSKWKKPAPVVVKDKGYVWKGSGMYPLSKNTPPLRASDLTYARAVGKTTAPVTAPVSPVKSVIPTAITECGVKYTREPKKILEIYEADASPVETTHEVIMNNQVWVARLNYGDEHHYLLDKDGKWWVEYRAGSGWQVFDADVQTACWRVFWDLLKEDEVGKFVHMGVEKKIAP